MDPFQLQGTEILSPDEKKERKKKRKKRRLVNRLVGCSRADMLRDTHTHIFTAALKCRQAVFDWCYNNYIVLIMIVYVQS